MSRLSKIIDIDKSKRFDENFNPDEIGLMLENYYFNKMRNKLFSEYLRSPNEETIKVIVREFDNEARSLAENTIVSRKSVNEFKSDSFDNALSSIKHLLFNVSQKED